MHSKFKIYLLWHNTSYSFIFGAAVFEITYHVRALHLVGLISKLCDHYSKMHLDSDKYNHFVFIDVMIFPTYSTNILIYVITYVQDQIKISSIMTL